MDDERWILVFEFVYKEMFCLYSNFVLGEVLVGENGKFEKLKDLIICLFLSVCLFIMDMKCFLVQIFYLFHSGQLSYLLSNIYPFMVIF